MKGSNPWNLLLLILSWCWFPSSAKRENCENGRPSGFTNLKVAPDLRSVTLSWKYLCHPEPAGFVVKMCEQARKEPNYHHCFEKVFTKEGSRDVLRTDGDGSYVTVIHDLRMMTEYTVSIEPVSDKNSVFSGPWDTSFDSRWRRPPPARVKMPFITKGFSAYVRKCYFNSSEIVVQTGPYFGGKISVENARDDRCSISGDRNSSKDVYILHIDHETCGSEVVNGTAVRTVVSIHESSSIVTLNSRKFLVQCNFLPETFTVEAAFKVPKLSDASDQPDTRTETDDDGMSNDIFTYEGYKQSHVKDSRISSMQAAASVLQSPKKPEYDSQVIGLISIIVIIAVVLLVGIAFGIWWYIGYRKYRGEDSANTSVPGSSITFYQYADGATTYKGDSSCHVIPTHRHYNDCMFQQSSDRSSPSAEVVLVSLKSCCK